MRNARLDKSQFSCSVMSNSLRPHELQHTRPPCPSPTPRVHPNPCPSSQWCHPTISSSAILFSCPQSFPASGSFQMSQFFTSGGQSTRVSASTSVLPMKDWKDESQAGIKIAGRNIDNLRYADDSTLMAESEEKLKGLLVGVRKESEKAG